MEMKILAISLGLMLGLSLESHGQEGYTVSGRVRELQTKQVYLLSSETGRTDTLGKAAVDNGVFLIQGKVDGVCEAFLTFEEVDATLPFLLENAVFQVMVTSHGFAFQGGGAEQELLRKFNQAAQEFAAGQQNIQVEATRMQGNAVGLKELQSRADKAYQDFQMKTAALIKANADRYASAYVIAAGMGNETEESLLNKYQALGKQAQATVPGKKIAAALEQYKKLADGEIAPNFTAVKPSGDSFSLHDVPGKLKLLHFWMPDNADCRQENTILVRLNLDYSPRGLEIISISLDKNAGKWKSAIGLDGMTWLNGLKPEAASLYRVSSVPYFVLVDADNRIVVKGLRGAELEKKVAELLKKKK